MPGIQGAVDTLAVGKKQCVIRRAINEALRGIKGLDQSAARALVTIGLSRVGHAGSNENE